MMKLVLLCAVHAGDGDNIVFCEDRRSWYAGDCNVIGRLACVGGWRGRKELIHRHASSSRGESG